MTLPVVGPNIPVMSDRKMRARDLAALRDDLGMTQVQLASLLRVTQVAVSCWENGTRPIKPHIAELIRLKVAEYRSQTAAVA